MSIGAPSNLGTLLVQRLDAALGATLGQQAGLAGAAGPQAVPQPGHPENPAVLQNSAQRHPQESVDQAAAEGGRRAAVGKATREMQLDNLLGRASTLSTTTQSAPTTLGYAARIILALLTAYPEADRPILSRTPLIPNPDRPPPGSAPAPQAASTAAQAAGSGAAPEALATATGEPGTLPARLAEALSHSIRTSGLFYESHLARLAAGEASLPDLRQEPQGRIRSTGAAQPQGAPAPAAQRSSLPAFDSNTPQAAQAPGPALALQTDAGRQSLVPGLDPQAQPLVRQQLDVLANQGFVWQGEPWPGTLMHWEVQRAERHEPGAQDDDDTQWATRLTLHLPALGEVQARLSLAGPHLVMRIVAPAAAPRLDEALGQLRTRLLARGLQPGGLSVMAAEPAPEPAERPAPAHEAATP